MGGSKRQNQANKFNFYPFTTKIWVYDFTAKTIWAKVKTGRNVNREKAYLVESQLRIKLKL